MTDLFSQYPIYNPRKGIYTTWGDIALPWDTENLPSDERWQAAEYVDTYAYRAGDIVLNIEDDGYRLTLYTALVDIPVPPGAFNLALWSEYCHTVVSEPYGIPPYSELVSKFPYYDPKVDLTSWSEFESDWGTDLTDPDSDQWDEAKIAKTYFYRSGDIVLWDVRCNDYTCVYIATADMPANPDLVALGPPPSTYFNRLYCTPNGKPNTCVKRVTCTKPNRKVVSLSNGNSDLVCVPVESTTGIRPRLV